VCCFQKTYLFLITKTDFRFPA